MYQYPNMASPKPCNVPILMPPIAEELLIDREYKISVRLALRIFSGIFILKNFFYYAW